IAQVVAPGRLFGSERRRVAERVDVAGVHAAHHASPAWHAHRIPAVGVAEVHAHAGNPVHVGSPGDRMAVAAEQASPVLVGADEDDIRLLYGGGAERGSPKSGAEISAGHITPSVSSHGLLCKQANGYLTVSRI